MARKKKWEQDYQDYIINNRDTTFDFGTHDCCITACNIIQIVTGTDPAAKFRGYDTPLKALKFVKEYGDVDLLADAICKEHGWPEVHPNFARRADLVCIDTGGGRKALGWMDVDGKRIVAVGMIGFQKLPRSSAIRAWRID